MRLKFLFNTTRILLVYGQTDGSALSLRTTVPWLGSFTGRNLRAMGLKNLKKCSDSMTVAVERLV